jgi:hypothetical protein
MIKKLVQSKYSLFFLAIFIVLLYVVLNKVVIPLVMKASDSNFFNEESQEDEQLGAITNERTTFAMIQCKTAMKEQNDLPENTQFPDDKYEAWALGNRTYLIRSSVLLTEDEKGAQKKLFACKIQYKEGDLSDFKNWSVLGIDFNGE